jgi:DNA-binding response OmpR family regulator
MVEQRTVLIVEDDAIIGQLLSTILKKQGYHTLQARNGTGAVGCAELYLNQIDLVICDVVLQFETGPAVAARVCALGPEARILFISGLPLDMLFERNLMRPDDLEDGRTFHLQKPFLPVELVCFAERILPTCGDSRSLDLDGRTNENVFTAH